MRELTSLIKLKGELYDLPLIQWSKKPHFRGQKSSNSAAKKAMLQRSKKPALKLQFINLKYFVDTLRITNFEKKN